MLESTVYKMQIFACAEELLELYAISHVASCNARVIQQQIQEAPILISFIIILPEQIQPSVNRTVLC